MTCVLLTFTRCVLMLCSILVATLVVVLTCVAYDLCVIDVY
jgi:hypothetical protein